MIASKVNILHQLLKKVRFFFYNRGYSEVVTPIMAPFLIPESYLDFFETKLKLPAGGSRKVFLTPSPELWHKRLLVQGSGNIFEISHRFRNGDIGSLHSPEFLLLEWYKLKASIYQTMAETEELVKEVIGRAEIIFNGNKVDLEQSFEKLSMDQAFNKYLGIKQEDFFNKEALIRVGQKYQVPIKPSWDWKNIFNLIYVSEIEPKLGFGRPTFIYNFPAQFAPLAKESQDSRFKERFELFINGLELCDGYSELTDADKQKQAFQAEVNEMKRLNKPVPEIDWGFIKALEKGLPDCSGVALGLDRLFMVAINKTKIKDVQLINLQF